MIPIFVVMTVPCGYGLVTCRPRYRSNKALAVASTAGGPSVGRYRMASLLIPILSHDVQMPLTVL